MMRVYINNVEVPVLKNSLTITQNITSKVDTCVFTFLKIASRNIRPKTFDEVIVKDGDEVIYGGVIEKVSDEVQSSDLFVYKVNATDFTFLFDRKLVAETYEKQSISNIAKDIVNRFSVGFDDSGIEEVDEKIKFIQFDYTRPSDALRDLADLVGYDWYIDYAKKVHFFPRGSRTAPFHLRDDNHSYFWKSLKLSKSAKQIKNVVYVIGSDYVGETTKDKVGSGNAKQKRWNLPYRYDKKPKVFLAGVEQTVGLEHLSNEGDFQSFWNANEKVISFKVEPAKDAGIEVEGSPLIPIFVKVKAPNNEIGDFEFKIVDKSLKTEDAVRKRAKAEIDIYSNAVDGGSFRTAKAGLQAGQRIIINSQKRGIENEAYIIQSIGIKELGNRLDYSVRIANAKSYDMVEFMRMLLRKGERERGSVRNPTSVLHTIVSVFDEIKVAQEEYFIRKNLNHQWVWGAYQPVSVDDLKRVPLWNDGVTWN